MENWKKVITVIIVIVAVFFLAKWLGLGGVLSYWANRKCVRSHEEQYMQAPLTLNVGGGKYGGGFGIPMGNIEIKTRTVCDEYSL